MEGTTRSVRCIESSICHISIYIKSRFDIHHYWPSKGDWNEALVVLWAILMSLPLFFFEYLTNLPQRWMISLVCVKHNTHADSLVVRHDINNLRVRHGRLMISSTVGNAAIHSSIVIGKNTTEAVRNRYAGQKFEGG